MRIRYNAPTVLTFAFASFLVLVLSQTVLPSLANYWFAVPGRGNFSAGSVGNWFSIVSHIAGHANWTHLIANFSFILLIGPILEENYGSVSLLFMILITALVTGILNVLFFPKPLMGPPGWCS